MSFELPASDVDFVVYRRVVGVVNVGILIEGVIKEMFRLLRRTLNGRILFKCHNYFTIM